MAPFVFEQMKAIQSLGIECKVILVKKGLKGYYTATKEIRQDIRSFSPDIIHAHYGLCGLIACLQQKVPVVTTFHGTDLHDKRLRLLSRFAARLSKGNIVVSSDLKKMIGKCDKVKVIPCGVVTDLLKPMDQSTAKTKLGWPPQDKRILFSKEFYNKAKNYPLAKAAVDYYNSTFAGDSEATLLEFIGYTREQVLLLYNAVDCVLMTSDHEGSPQFIKEAMACNCPIVSVDVGDVKDIISGTPGCYLAERNPVDLAQKIDAAIKHGKTNGREKIILKYESGIIANKVVDLYKEVLSNG